jgi:hypothetical protein
VAPQIRKDYATNQKLLRRYDGCRADLGMSAGQAEMLFEEPLRVSATKSGRTARIYGENRDLHLQVNDACLFSDVAVVFDRQERILAIYSQDFFNDDWKK